MTTLVLSRRKPWLVLVLGVVSALVSAWACTFTFIAAYDEAIDRGATSLQKRMDAHLTQLARLSGEAAAYPKHAAFYDEYEVELRSLRLRAETHPNTEQSIQQYELIQQSVATLRGLHEQAPLGKPVIEQKRTLFNLAWQPIIKLEVEKRHGD